MNKFAIKSINARQILDSRGWPTVEAKVTLMGGESAVASVPSGASTGAAEAWELRDGAKAHLGKGVLKAVKNVKGPIAKAVKGMDVTKLKQIDQAMIDLDGTDNKKKLGANAILAVSLACARAGAQQKGIPLFQHIRSMYRVKQKGWKFPLPMMNIINGGQHAANTVSIQEFMVVPMGSTMDKRIWKGQEVFQHLKKLLKAGGHTTLVGDEGGFAPNFKENEEALQYIVQAIKAAGFKPGKDVAIAMDLAASEFYFEKQGGYDFDYKIKGKKGKDFKDVKAIVAMLSSWLKKYPIVSIEDPLDEDAWEDWQYLTEKLGKKVQVVGDDLFVTNTKRLQKGIDMGVSNSILIKVNQIGSLSETIAAINLARKNKFSVIISHRSGETEDTTIADLALAVNAEFIKTGSLSRSERVAKYNRLMAIELGLKKKW
jgi:enolase